MRKCKIAPASCNAPGRPCCADCKDKTCQARCWNSPKRCNCWEEDRPRKPGGPRKVDRDKVRKLHARGKTQIQIAVELGTTPQTVRKILREMEAEKHGDL